jgi:hypothetical protein
MSDMSAVSALSAQTVIWCPRVLWHYGTDHVGGALMRISDRRGDGPRHRADCATKADQHERELVQAKREIDRLQARVSALTGTVQVINKLSSHYTTDKDQRRGRAVLPPIKPR